MRWKDDIPEEIKQERLHRLMDLHSEIASEERAKLLNTTQEVLVEHKKQNGQLYGRTRCWKKVIFDGPESMVGTLQNIDIHGSAHETLIGTIDTPALV